MTDQSVDLTALREMTGGDAALEHELFGAFIQGAEECLSGLEGATTPEEWRRHAHAFKGISRNLGATALGELCAAAQDAQEAGDAEKAKILAGIKDEYARVRAFLAPLMAQ